MTVTLNFYDVARKLSYQQRAAFTAHAEFSIQAIKKRTTLEKIDILFLVTSNYSHGTYSFCGHTMSPHIVTFFVDPEVNSLSVDIESYFSALLAQELHHCLRWPYFRKTIGEAIVLEGMAMSAETLLGFDERQLGASPNSSEMEKMFETAFQQIDNSHDDSWIYQTPNLKEHSWQWIYHLGRHIVGLAFKAENWNAFDQINKSAKEIFEAAQRGSCT